MTSSLDISSLISKIDWLVFFIILFITLLSVVYGHILKSKSVKKSSEADFLDMMVMGRQLTLPMFVATLVATWYGGIFGVTQIAFERGIFNFITQGLFWYLTYLIFAFWIVERIHGFKALTLPDLLSRLVGPRAAYLSSIFNFFNVVPIVYAISLGLFLQLLFGGDFILMMSVGIVFVAFYSMLGGLRAVIFSDVVQFGVMLLAVFLVLAYSVGNYGFAILLEKLPDTHWTLTGGQGVGLTLAWGFIALSTLVDPNFYQRCFAAKSSRVAKKGIIISTVVWMAFDICTTLGAMYARVLIPEAVSSKAYLIYSMQLLPGGLKGLMLAGILATILSTIDSYMFLASATLSFDMLPKRFRGRVGFHRIGLFVVAAIAIIMAYLFDGNIRKVWKILGSYSAACLLLPVMLVYIFPGRIGDRQFVTASIFGVIGTTTWMIVPLGGILAGIDELYVGSLCALLGLAVGRLMVKKDFPT